MKGLIFLIPFVLFSCTDAKIVEEGGVVDKRPIDRDYGIEMSGYEFDLPRDHDRFSTAGFDSNQQVKYLDLNYQSPMALEIPESRSAQIRINVETNCTDYRDLATQRERFFRNSGYLQGTLPKFDVSRRIESQGYTVARDREVMVEYVFDRGANRDSCLLFNVVIRIKSNRFHLSRLGDLERVIDTILWSVRAD